MKLESKTRFGQTGGEV